jgi:dihydrofolate reductase
VIKIIVAKSKNGIIGDSNKLLWNLPNDLANFKRLTTGHPIIMGRKTFESIGRVLPGRRNIIISRDADLLIPEAEVVNSISEALLLTNNDCFVIGGGEIYKQTLDVAEKIYLTEVDGDFYGDTFFPEIDPSWVKTSQRDFTADDKNKYNYSFITYERFQF